MRVVLRWFDVVDEMDERVAIRLILLLGRIYGRFGL